MLSGMVNRGARLLAIALAFAVALSSSVGHAQSRSDGLARRHFDAGVACLEEGDYDSARRGFQKSYDLSNPPEILLNIAAVQKGQRRLSAAVASLQAYWEAAPQDERAETVELRIPNLETRSQQQNQAKPAAEPVPAPSSPPAAPARPASKKPPPEAEPNRLPALISIGVGGLMAGGALATGLIAKLKYDGAEASCHHSCPDGELSSSRAFALTSTVLTGGAVLGVGLGVVLLSLQGETDLGRSAPRVDVAMGPHAAAASAAWSF